MDTIGKHLLLELHGCDKALLNDLNYIKKCMTESAEKANATIVNSTFKAFDPQGVTGVVVLEESHISIHTWPEKEYASLDFYTCGNAEPVNAKQHME
ncbi:S-adenosylmethionine decarboxylase proenzyme, partial [Oleiphilus sp. HI0009]